MTPGEDAGIQPGAAPVMAYSHEDLDIDDGPLVDHVDGRRVQPLARGRVTGYTLVDDPDGQPVGVERGASVVWEIGDVIRE